MYNGVNLYSYQMKNDEKVLTEKLRCECMKICDTLDIPRTKLINGSPYMGRLKDNCDFLIKYKKAIGYFVLDGERGVFTLRDGFPEKNSEKAKYRLLTYEFMKGGGQYELMNRCNLQATWQKTYRVEYDSRKAAFEYAIQKHAESLSCFTDEVIAKYTDYMNKWFGEPHWCFNRKNMLFEEYCPI
jgi:hypothetical protein